ncbi:PepSY domain-containing protein [Pseudoduganella sp. UC29_71]|uniref:PepSY domain-containing protein n=1 Tax=Pseudoduganella sp. UC29_71 TaxID=3350174 RepID=UPI00366DF16F
MNGLRALHRWTGLAAGWLFAIVALTGALMAFRVQLEPLVSSALATVPACTAPLPLDALVAAARTASPDSGPLTALRLYGNSRTSARVRFGDERWIYVDPCSARVLGSEAVYGGPFGTVARLHIFGYLPFGELLAGSLALLMALAMAAAGLRLWWPASLRMLRSSWRIKRGLQGRARSLNLHKTVAIYAAPVLLACALTGLPQAFSWARSAIDALADFPARPAVRPPGAPQPAALPAPERAHAGVPRNTAGVRLEAMWRQAQALSPAPQKLQLRAPPAPGAPWLLEAVARDAPHANALSYFYFDPASGALLRHTPYAAHSRGHRAYLWMLALHYGWIGGLAGQAILLLGALAVPLLAWTGTASYLRGRRTASAAARAPALMRVVVLRKRSEAEGICSFELASPDGAALPSYTAGAHVEVVTPGGHVRHYSLCGDLRDRHRYRIAVLRCRDTRGGSASMHAELHEGATLEISAPRNHFPLAARAQHSVLLAGGIGITPILSMARQLAADGASFELHYSCRTERHAAFRDELGAAPFAARTHFHYSAGGRLDLDTLLRLPAPGVHIYACGPGAFMDAVARAAQRHGWPEGQLHAERFSASADPLAGARLASGPAFDVRIASTGQVVRVPEGVTALAAMAGSGVHVQSSCGQGVCGTCVTGVLQGRPDHRDQCLSAAERARNDRFTPCCSRAIGPLLVLDL